MGFPFSVPHVAPLDSPIGEWDRRCRVCSYCRHVRMSTRARRIRSSCPCYERRSCSCPTVVTDPAGPQNVYCWDRSVCFFLFLLRRRSFCRFLPSYHVVVVRRRPAPPLGAQWFIHMALNQAWTRTYFYRHLYNRMELCTLINATRFATRFWQLWVRHGVK